MSKLKNAVCVNCHRRIGRHDKDHLSVKVGEDKNPYPPTVIFHRKCPEVRN